MARGGYRPGAGRKPDPNSKRQKAKAARELRLSCELVRPAALLGQGPEMRPARLTERQSYFVDEYINVRSATLAAIAAGYSARTARQAGSRLLRHPVVAAQIEHLGGQRPKRGGARPNAGRKIGPNSPFAAQALSDALRQAAECINRLLEETKPNPPIRAADAKESVEYAMKQLKAAQRRAGIYERIPYQLAEAKKLQLAIKRLIWQESKR